MSDIEGFLVKNGLVLAFLFVGITMFITSWLSRRFTQNKIPGVAIAIFGALVLAYFGGERGLAEYPIFAGLAIL